MTEKYDEAHRGRELVTFSNYCVYGSMVKKHVGDLNQPALDTLDFNLHFLCMCIMFDMINNNGFHLRYCAEGVQSHV